MLGWAKLQRRIWRGLPRRTATTLFRDRASGKFSHAVRDNFRQLHYLLAQFGVFRNVALNAVAIGLQFSPERLKLTEDTVNFAHRSH